VENELGRKIRMLRHKRSLTQQELGYRTGISTPHISSIERGERHPSLVYAVRLAEALGVPIGYFCDGADITNLPDETSYGGAADLPGYLQAFVARETSQPYIAMAHRVSRLEAKDYEVICAMVEIMMQRRKLKIFSEDALE
jgi:transcriptional regulator with XRE-family HTH domain